MGGWIKTFYMPLFFLISGMFFKPIRLHQKVKHLMVPYLWFYALAFVAYVLKTMAKKETVIWESFFIPFVGGTGGYQNTPLWFLMSLCEIMIISYFIIKIKANKMVVLPLSFVAATLASKVPEGSICHMYNIDISIVCLPFFLTGYYFNDAIKEKVNQNYSLLMIIVSFLLYFINPVFTNVSTNYLPQGYSLFCIVSISATIGIVGLCHAIKGNSIIRGIQFCGRNSLIILCTHMIFMTIDSICVSMIKEVLWAALISFACLMTVETCVCHLINRYMKFTLGK